MRVLIIIEGENFMCPSVTASFTVTVKPTAPPPSPLTIEPNGGNLAEETQGTADNGDKVCVISGGTPPYQLSVNQGSLPPGMQLSSEQNADGSLAVFIEGTPTQSGAFSFGLTVTDSAGASLQVQPRGPQAVPSAGGNSAPA
jgi:hypothetical protein